MLVIKPFKNFVLISPSTSDTETKGGLLMPESSNEAPHQGTVIRIGPFLDGYQLKEGQQVIYKKWAGDEIKVHGETYRLIKVDDLMAGLEEDGENN